MTHYKDNHAPADGSKYKSDGQDRRQGAHDNVAPKPAHPMKEHATPHQRAQHGADVRAETEPRDDSTPEGLRRKPKGPYGPTTGRANEKADD